MKDQDYIKIMDRIREDHIENAVLWDVSAQPNRRSIRQLSMGVAAVAAAIAVCIGILGYRTSRGLLHSDQSSTGSVTSEPDTAAVTEIIAQTDSTFTETVAVTGSGNAVIMTQISTETTAAVTTETAGDPSAEAASNVFGGSGTLRSFRNTLLDSAQYLYRLAEDDAYIYDLAHGQRAAKTGEDTVFEAYSFPTVPDYDPAADQLFVTGGLCFLKRGSTMFTVQQSGNETELVHLCPGTWPAETRALAENEIAYDELTAFDPDETGKPTKLFVRKKVRYKGAGGSETLVKGIADLKTGTFRSLDSISSGDADCCIVKDHAVYLFTYHNGNAQAELTRISPDGRTEMHDITDWGLKKDDVGLFLDCYAGAEESFCFVNYEGQLCRASFDEWTPAVIAEQYSYPSGCILTGIKDQTVAALNSPPRIVLGKDNGTEDTILLQGDSEQTFGYDLFGVYRDGTALHICAVSSEKNDAANKYIFITQDGSGVSSFSIPVVY